MEKSEKNLEHYYTKYNTIATSSRRSSMNYNKQDITIVCRKKPG